MRFWDLNGAHQTMNRNILYLVIGVLVAATAVFGYQLYQERQKTTGIEISVGKSGISIEKK
jgi:predicted negative regulator of RcsB-dependent stress response